MRNKIGLFFVFLWFIGPFVGMLIPWLGLSAKTTGIFVSFFLFGGSSLFLVLGFIFLGKNGVIHYKNKLVNTYANKKRYYSGLIITIVSILANWILAYLSIMKIVVLDQETQLYTTLTFDMLMILGITIMGPEFFNKIKAIGHWQGEEKT
jgi:hypothetical protein